MLFIFDENFPQSLVEGISLLEKANKRSPFPVNIIHAISFMGKNGASDEEIIKAATQNSSVIITHDSDFKRIKHYKQLLIDHQVGYVFFKTPKGKYEYWDIVKAFINSWEPLKKEVSICTHPFAIEINTKGQVNSALAF
mgnify:CR=1 FL=1